MAESGCKAEIESAHLWAGFGAFARHVADRLCNHLQVVDDIGYADDGASECLYGEEPLV